jgi:hypothetical protein
MLVRLTTSPSPWIGHLKSKVAAFVDLYRRKAELVDAGRKRRTAERELSRVNENLEAKIRAYCERPSRRFAAQGVEMRRQTRRALQAKQAAEAANLANQLWPT